MALEQELKTYEAKLHELLPDNAGKFVLIQGEQVAGVWDTYQDALKAGYEKFKLTPFLVKRIQGVEQVQFFTRDLPVTCHN